MTTDSDQKERLRVAKEKLLEAEQAWQAFAHSCDQTSLERERAFSVSEKLRLASRIFG